MTKDWANTSSDDDADARAMAFWAEMRADSDEGRFWADRIKEYRGEPAKRLALAMKNLPLPAAFREAAIAVRALIRAKRTAAESINEELTLLYRLAAMRSFILDYAPRLQEPGFNVIETIPGSRLRSLSYTYSQLGYRYLALLNKTDVRWLVEAWGEPDSHSTLNDIHRSLWDEYESKLIEKRRKSDESTPEELESFSEVGNEPSRSPQKKAALGCSVALLAAVVVVTMLAMCWAQL